MTKGHTKISTTQTNRKMKTYYRKTEFKILINSI